MVEDEIYGAQDDRRGIEEEVFMSEPHKEMLTREHVEGILDIEDHHGCAYVNEGEIENLLKHDAAQRAEIEELRALVGEDKLALFHRLKNEEAKATNRDTAGCQTCRAEIERLTSDLVMANEWAAKNEGLMSCQDDAIASLAEQVRTLREAIENAPHEHLCWGDMIHWDTDCKCWKSSALSASPAPAPMTKEKQ